MLSNRLLLSMLEDGPEDAVSGYRTDALRIATPAKLNLFLEVLGKRPDGYHDIATLMVAIDLTDEILFERREADSLELSCDRDDLPVGPENLILRAAEVLRRSTGCRLGARIRLWKRIPFQAGLGGGSGNAAGTLLALNRLWRLGLSRVELAELSASLGSDIPFFFHLPAAWCTGRGEIVEAAPIGRSLDFVIVQPPVGLATAAVYRGVRVPAVPLDGTAIRDALALGDTIALGRLLHNRLQEPAFASSPLTAELHQRLRSLGTLGTLLTGSGSCLFALCRDRAEAERCAAELRDGANALGASTRVYVVRSCSISATDR